MKSNEIVSFHNSHHWLCSKAANFSLVYTIELKQNKDTFGFHFIFSPFALDNEMLLL